MSYIKHLLKSYPVTSFYILTIWILCFASIPQTPLGTFGTLWLEYLRRHKRKCDIGGGFRYEIDKGKLFLLAWLAPVMMSGLIEILQATCTGGRRSGEWLDFAANSIGVTLAAIGGIIWMKIRNRKAKN